MARVAVSEGRGLLVDGTTVPLLSGTLHYWRHDPDRWSALLRVVKNLGFTFVETYIPWGVHEISSRSFDFGGLDPRRSLEGFITCVKKAGLKLIVRPGPHINAELTDFGYPRRIVTDPEIIAREAHGGFAVYEAAPRPFGIPSYASEKFYQEVAIWFDAIAPLLKRHLHPEGPIAAVQVDNETGYFFRTGAYQLDYHPDSIAWYRRFLKVRYGEVKALNATYGTAHSVFDQVEPPRRFTGKGVEDLPYHLDWQLYKEYQILGSLKRLKAMWVERGVKDVPFFQNYFGSTETPFDLSATEGERCGLDVAGLDDYSRRGSWRELAFKSLFLSGTSRLPFIPEFGAGSWAFPPCEYAPDERDTRFTAPLLYMFGVKAVNHYMVVERDRWMGSPISAEGEVRKDCAAVHRELNVFVKDSHVLEMDLQADLLVLANREAGRLRRVLSLADDHPYLRWPASASLAEVPLPFAVPPHEDHSVRLKKTIDLALDRRLPFRISDTSLSFERMKAYKALVLPTYEMLGRVAQQSLRRFVEEGGALLAGPSMPGFDTKREPFSAFPAYQIGKPIAIGKGRLLLLEEWNDEAAIGFLAEAGVAPLLPHLPEGVLATRFTASGREVLFLANPTDEEKALPPVREKGRGDWRPLFGALQPWKAGKGLTLAPWSVVAFEVAKGNEG